MWQGGGAADYGYLTLIRYSPQPRKATIDSPRPTRKIEEFAYNEQRYKLLQKNHPQEAGRLMQLAQESLDLRWHTYEHMSKQDPSEFQPTM